MCNCCAKSGTAFCVICLGFVLFVFHVFLLYELVGVMADEILDNSD